MPAFFARLAKDAIQVYKAPEMTLLDKKSVKLPGVSEFCWSPGEPILATFQPEQNGGNVPARISLIQLPSRNEVRSKNLFNVSDVKMFWQSQGDYFAVKVDHHTKSKRARTVALNCFVCVNLCVRWKSSLCQTNRKRLSLSRGNPKVIALP